MRKMGWREGEGLGKNKEGNKEPILVDFKTDRKGKFLECFLICPLPFRVSLLLYIFFCYQWPGTGGTPYSIYQALG